MLPATETDRDILRDILKYDSSNSSFTTMELPSSTYYELPSNVEDQGSPWGALRRGDVAGFSAGILVLLLIIVGVVWKWLWSPSTKRRSLYGPTIPRTPSAVSLQHLCRRSCEVVDNESDTSSITEPHQNQPTAEKLVDVPTDWHCGPRQLHAKDVGWYLESTWDVLLTVAPVFFIVLPVLILQLNGESLSTQGESIQRVIRLSPTIYPILFAAICSRFYKNLARWRLEQPGGINMAALEQVSGSQSFAGAFERLFLVRTHVRIGFAILIVWAMSPLGGQGIVRSLSIGRAITPANRIILYVHPSYQVSYYSISTFATRASSTVNLLYSSSLLSPPKQKKSPRDLWDLPKIPQWRKDALDEVYYADEAALGRDDVHYVSLLGVDVQGIIAPTEKTQYDFSVETTYFDFDCEEPTHDLDGSFGILKSFRDYTFAATIRGEGSLEASSLNATKSLYLLFASRSGGLFNCTIEPMVVETDIRCGASPSTATCSARRQRRLDHQDTASRFLEKLIERPEALQHVFKAWPYADGVGERTETSSPTVNFLSGNANPYAEVKGGSWRIVPSTEVSKRLTTAFNTFWTATLNPYGYTDVSLTSYPESNVLSRLIPQSKAFMNISAAVVNTERTVYRANRFWITVVLITTFVLQFLAVTGFALRYFIKGPDVLGFASSMTRDNPYVPLPPGGSGLDGPDRARLLQTMRIQLVDVRPEQDVGYIAVQTVPTAGSEQVVGEEDTVAMRPFTRRRFYM
ncbi:hypothetical protein B0T10DRAFT_574855 [Thelonectria olida]|uniref:Uncharacterized protein n=1 Tax=Thelonectria olida TaxID=1576542 RepID=A0A9P8W1J8_9HYPO|nr:hypothetical protein B0T10DRAFT_574855 [Thelonectria olida]